METLSHTVIGRIISVMNPDMVQELIEQYTPLSKDKALVPAVFQCVEKHFPEMDAFDRKLLFIAVVYRIYIPASFLPSMERPDQRCSQAVHKLPAGTRNEMAKCLGLKHAEEVNRFKSYAEPFIKNPRYRAKMRIITDAIGLTKPKV